MNTYFPVDPKTIRFNENELLEILNVIENVLQVNEFNYICWGGDINSDFARNTGFVHTVNQFVGELDLIKASDKFEIDFTHVHEAGGVTFVSKIDHFFWNSSFDNKISDAGVLHLTDNMSDHEVIYCVINTSGFDKVSTEERGAKQPNKQTNKRYISVSKTNIAYNPTLQ